MRRISRQMAHFRVRRRLKFSENAPAPICKNRRILPLKMAHLAHFTNFWSKSAHFRPFLTNLAHFGESRAKSTKNWELTHASNPRQNGKKWKQIVAYFSPKMTKLAHLGLKICQRLFRLIFRKKNGWSHLKRGKRRQIGSKSGAFRLKKWRKWAHFGFKTGVNRRILTSKKCAGGKKWRLVRRISATKRRILKIFIWQHWTK